MKTKLVLKKSFLIFLSIVMVFSSIPTFAVLSSAASRNEKTGITVYGETENAVVSGAVEKKINMRNENNENVKGYMLTLTPSAATGLKASYKDYYGTGKTKESRAKAAENWKRWGMQKMTDQAKAYEASADTEGKVVFATNGDYYNMANGQPLGSCIMEGNADINPNNEEPYFALLKDGTCAVREASVPKTDVLECIAGPFLLLKDGVNQHSLDNKDLMPRNSVGVKADGTVVFLEVDGRQETSVGMTLCELAEMLKDEGCVNALYLDGGGSATFATKREGEDTLSVRNSPSDGTERTVSSGMLLVSTASGDDTFDHAKLSPKNEIYTPGSEVQFSAIGIGNSGKRVDLPEGCTYVLADDSKDFGSIDEATGLFTANAEYAGEAKTVTVQMMQSARKVGETKIIIAVPDELRFSTDSITLDYEEKSTLGFSAYYDGREINYKTGDFNWSFETTQTSDQSATIGYVESDNIFVATGNNDAGNLSVQATVTAASQWDNAVTASITVGVGMKPVIVMDGGDGTEQTPLNYNNIAYTHAAADGGGIAFETHPEDHGDVVVCHYINGDGSSRGGVASAEVVDRDTGMVRKGQHALKLNYDFTNTNGIEGACVGFSKDIVIEGNPSAVGIWVYAPEGTPNLWLRLRCRAGGMEGAIKTLDFTKRADQATDGTHGGVNWVGWKYLECSLKDVQGPIVLLAGETFRVMDTVNSYGRMGRWVCTKDDAGNVSEAIEYQNGLKGYMYIDNMSFVYGSAQEDVDNPKINDIKVGPDMQHLDTIDAEGKSIVESNKVSFSAEFADVHNKLSTGINYAYLYLDGVNMTKKFKDTENEHYAESLADGKMSLSDMTLANGTHTVTLLTVDGNDNEASVTRTFTVQGNDESLTSVDITADSQAELGKDFTLTLDSNKLEDVKSVETNIVVSEETPIKEVVFADGYNGSFEIKGNTVAIKAEKTGEQTGEGAIATIKLGIPYTLHEGYYLTYKVENGTVEYAQAKDDSVANTFATSTVKVPVVAKYNITVQTNVVGNDYGGILVTDANGKPAVGVAVYSGDKKLGITGNDGICNTDEFIGSVQEIYVYAKGKDGYSFAKKAQSLKALGDESGKPYHIISNATLDASTTKNIVWMSNPIASAEQAVMQYAKKSDYDAQGEAAFTDFEGKTTLSEFTASGNINENGAVFVKQTLLTGLAPATEYCYRVGDGEIFSDVKSFTTYKQYDRKGGNSLKFFVIGDAQTDDENVNNLVQIIEDTKTGYDFGTQIGDAVEVPKLYSDWNNFLTQFSAYDVDFLHAIGNHETFSDPGATNANTIFGTPNSKYYSTVYGGVYFATVAFTENRAELEEAANWLAEDAAKATTPWKVLVMHQPPYYTNSGGGNEIIQKLFAPAVDKGGIDFVFAGHDHSYARTYPIIGGKVAEDYQMADKGEAEVTTYSGDGAIYYIAGSTGQKAYPIDTQVPHFGSFSKATIDFDSIYLSIEADDEQFTVKTMDGETEIDSFTKLSKSKTCAHVYDYYDASDASLHCEKCGRLFDAKKIAYTGVVNDFETGKLRFLADGEPQTGIQTINDKAVVFDDNALGYDGTLDIAGTIYTFKNGSLTDCSDKAAGEVFFGYCGAEAGGKNLVYAYQPGNEIVNIGVNPMMENATGVMKDWANFKDVPWQTHRLTITKYNIGEGVTTVGDYMAYISANPAPEQVQGVDSELREINLPSTLEKIGKSAFFNNVNLKKVTIPASVTAIGPSAFSRIRGIQVTMLGTTVPQTDSEVSSFAYCGAKSVLNVKCSEAWHDALSAKIFHFPGSVNYTDHDAQNLQTVKKAISLKTKGSEITTCCVCGTQVSAKYFTLDTGNTFTKDNGKYKITKKDKTVTLIQYTNTKAVGVAMRDVVDYGGVRYTITAIGSKAFAGKTKLKNLALPDTVKNIETAAFKGCTGLKNVKFGGTVFDIVKIAADNAPLTKAKKSYAKTMYVLLSPAKATYDGKVKKAKVTVKDSSGKVLKLGTDYTLTVAKGRINVGRYAVKVNFKGAYKGSKLVYFNIVPKGTALTKVSGGKSAFTAKWAKQTTQTTGYQVQYATNANFTGAKLVTVRNNKTLSVTVNGLKAGTYYVRVRTFKTVSGIHYMSAWSKAVKAAVK